MTPDRPHYFELDDIGLISFSGEDAAAFLHAQLTSDVLALRAPSTQYSGYCSPKGRLLATFLVWRLDDGIVLQLPAALREAIQARLARYVLRAKVKVADATARYRLFGIAGRGADAALSAAFGATPASVHAVTGNAAVRIAAIPGERYLLLTDANEQAVRAKLDAAFARGDSGDWRALDVQAGIPAIGEGSQDEYVPQMVNLDLVGGVSFNKGCYPGQEIVARMHYLGRLKQRMYRIRVSGAGDLAAGGPLYSPEFGADQASGAILYRGAADEALAVIQRSSAGSAVHYGAPDGPQVEFLPLPYTLPE